MNDPYVEYLNELYVKALQKIVHLQYICTQHEEEIRQLQIKLQEKTNEKVDSPAFTNNILRL